MDHSNILEHLIALLAAHDIEYCVIGGQAVNAYAEPVVSLDLDLVIAVGQFELAVALLEENFTVKKFPHSLNVYQEGSDLRVQIQTDTRYFDFPSRAISQEVLGLELPVASLEDTLQGKIWAALDTDRRGSKRQKDLADIARLIETHPFLRSQVPQEILSRLV
ncbi:MAG: nucleotidyl transferase AbiEii/AbiGii toxin family protein [Candidatus Latescibacteria bacterium]|nr:nucleotidyl transferase AbiEii/AbiGii toxin family protein [Candidatus Latescibacterota bacterium]